MQPRKVQDRIAAASVPITPMYQDASRGLPFDDCSFDTVVTAWTLCSIDNVESALGEIGRVLKPSGSYLFLEHGRSADLRVVRRQDFIAPAVRVVGAGCRMNRRIDRLISEAGLRTGCSRALSDAQYAVHFGGDVPRSCDPSEGGKR